MKLSTKLLGLVYYLSTNCNVSCHTLGIHGLDGVDPPMPSPVLKEIYGAFEIVVVARFNNGGFGQTIFDFGNGSAQDNIALHRSTFSNNMRFVVRSGSIEESVVANGAITLGSTDTWKVGLTSDSILYIKKNGTLLASKSAGIAGVPRVNRTVKIIGHAIEPNWYVEPLGGAVLGLQIKNEADPDERFRLFEHMNSPGQAFHPFIASVYVRFDDLSGRSNQRVFDFGNGEANDNIILRQKDETDELLLEVYEDGVFYSCNAGSGVLVEEESAYWHVGIDGDGTFWLDKNGIRIKTCPEVHILKYKFRRSLLFGESNWNDPGHDDLDGFVLGFRLDLQSTS